jgi:hypothetical protein
MGLWYVKDICELDNLRDAVFHELRLSVGTEFVRISKKLRSQTRVFLMVLSVESW